MGVLGVFWLWNGIAYHLVFFARINGAAYGFAALFTLQGILFLAQSAKATSALSPVRWTPKTIMGAVFIAYSTLLYSVLGAWFGHGWPGAPTEVSS